MEDNKRIPCMKCVHYYTTFDPRAPRGCKLYEFKSGLMPYILVKQSTGHDCTHFKERPKKDDGDGGTGGKVDFNDPKYW